MTVIMIGISELRKKFGAYLQRLKAGITIVVTRPGEPFAKIVPKPNTIQDKMQSVVDHGLADWNGRKVKPNKPAVINQSNIQVASLVSQDRDAGPHQ